MGKTSKWMGVKLNFDGGLDIHNRMSGLGIVIREDNGRFRAARALHLGFVMSPLFLEAMAARECLVFAKEIGLQRIHIEGDSLQMVKLIDQDNKDSFSSVWGSHSRCEAVDARL